ncbi:unnamed protein product [Discula destructiva]
MSSPSGRTYADAIDVLNTLQTPFAVIEARRKAGVKPDESSIREMKAYWARLGHTPDDLNRLNAIHVAGTKGKGSVCAFVASILSQHQHHRRRPHKIGLLTSPHLIAVRERIRLDGAPLSETLFAQYFFEVHDLLSSSTSSPATADADAAQPGSKPIYARFLTLLAFHVFVREGVDAAVVETGVGGAFDASNIVARPVVTGVSTLGIDHVYMLGGTVEEIAWHKAGIMKAGCRAFAVEQQQPEAKGAEAVLRARAEEIGVEGGAVTVVGVDERLARGGVRVRPDAVFQRRNASLAVALAEAALERIDPEGFRRGGVEEEGEGALLPVGFKEGIEGVVWRGRCDVKEEGRVRWLIDGAHTTDSLKVAAKWFTEECEGRTGPRVLIFNQQGRTEAIDFLDGLHSGAQRADGTSFDHVLFCTNITHAATGYKRDFVNHQYDPEAIKKLTVQRQFAERWAALDPKAKVSVVPSIEETIVQARDLTGTLKEGESVQAFITGSLHLVGGALGILEGAAVL